MFVEILNGVLALFFVGVCTTCCVGVIATFSDMGDNPAEFYKRNQREM